MDHSIIRPAGERAAHPNAEPTARSPGGRPRRTVFPDTPRPEAPTASCRLRGELGTASRLLAQLECEHRADPFGQLMAFFSTFRIPAATGRKRTVSRKTEAKYFHIMKRVLNGLVELHRPVRNLSELSAKHVRAVTRQWENAGASASSLAALNTVLRRFGIWIGKPDMAPPLGELLMNPDAARRSSSLARPRTWESRGIDPEDVFKAMETECPVTAMQLRLAWAFGLRVEEQLMLRPVEAHQGSVLEIHHGTKGGKWRKVPIEEPWQLALLERAKELAASHPKGILTPKPWKELDKVRDHYYYLCRKIGLRAEGRFRSTPHGARHSYAVRRFERLGGVPAPVLSGPKLQREMDRRVRQQLAEELGHGRPSVTSAYIGTTAHLCRLERTRLACLAERERLLASDPQLISLARQAGLTAFCLIGPAATGDALDGTTLLRLQSAGSVTAR